MNFRFGHGFSTCGCRRPLPNAEIEFSTLVGQTKFP
jgi:hypothetical protein